MVLVGRSKNVEPRIYHDGEKVLHVEKRVLVGPHNGAPNFSMRRFTVGKGGCSPYHTHAWEHEVYILAGQGEVRAKVKSALLAEATQSPLEILPSFLRMTNTNSSIQEMACLSSSAWCPSTAKTDRWHSEPWSA